MRDSVRGIIIETIEAITDIGKKHYEGGTVSGCYVVADRNNDGSIYVRIDEPKPSKLKASRAANNLLRR